MENKKLAQELKANLSRLIEKRKTWESHWQECADLFLPRRADITEKHTRGDKRNIQIFDATSTHSLELLASSLHGTLTSSATRWFSLRFKNAVLNDEDSAREWLENSTDKMYLAFSRSNFQQSVYECYFDLLCFGTAAVFLESDEEDIIRFSARHIKEIYIAENDKGLINCIYRKFSMTAKAAVEKWGLENLSKNIQSIFKNAPFDEVEFCHVVKPREMYDPRKLDKINMPFISIYFEMESENVISQGGFREFPYLVPRWLKSSNEIWGRSPAMSCLPDVKVLNKLVETQLLAAAKQINPPLLIPDDSAVLPIRTSPGSLNFYRGGARDKIEPLNIGANPGLGLNLEEARRRSIAKAFFVDQLLIQEASSTRTLTATEVQARQEERLKILGPTMGRLQNELLQPMITRVFNIMLRNGHFIEAPEILANQEIEIEYISSMVLSQKASQLSGIMRGMEVFGSISQVAPVMDFLDSNGLVKELIKILGLPATMIKSDSEVEEIRAERQEQQIKQAEMQQAMQEAQVAKDAAPMVQQLNEATNKQA
jgi:hypothetical protein|tara:strand:- start:2046 stop:3671 length:1626 start_codon:yes stop_codon:yes gene_type:complete